MTRTMCCPKCGHEDVWEKEKVTNYAAIVIDDDGDIVEIAANEADYDDSEPIGMWCSRCGYRTEYKTGPGLAERLKSQNEVRLLWSKTEGE